MKKRYVAKIFVLVVALVMLVSLLVACWEKDTPKEPQKLSVATVRLNDDLATWDSNFNADKVEICIDGIITQADLMIESWQLTDGQSLKIRFIGDGINFITSDWSNVVTYSVGETPEEPTEPETPSNPEEPTEPSEPSTPTEPETPSNPEEPTEPENPSNPEEPETQSVTASMTATQMAEYIGSTRDGTVMSGEVIMLDTNVGVAFLKGSAQNEPAYYKNAVRIYQNGGKATFSALNGSVIERIVITFTDSKSGGSGLKVSGGTHVVNGDTITITASANTTSVTITASGSSKDTGRLYVGSLSITYVGGEPVGEGGGDTPINPNPPVEPEEPETPVEPEEPDTPINPTYTYTNFTSAQNDYIYNNTGVNLPFLPTNDLYYEEYDEDGYVGAYISFECDSESRAQAYFDTLDSLYTYDESWEDEYGDTWYLYSFGDTYIDVCYYLADDDKYYLDVDVYLESESGNVGGGDIGGGTGTGSANEDLITNAGAGLPEGTEGVYNVDFTKATNVKDVTDQGYYLDGCPTVGAPGVLVIPVEFSDVTASSKGYSIDKIKNAFLKDGVNDYYSVYDYYFKASYGKLALDITVLDEWFRPSNPSTYYANKTMDYYGEEVLIGDQVVIDEALAYLEDKMDLSKFDSDGNNIIDAVVLVTTLEIDSDTTFYWAYRYWNIYVDSQENYYEYDGVSANDYLWAPYQFLYESEDALGDVSFTDTTAMNTYTFIHEFGHVLGADDYYDTAYVNSPLGGYDVMDAMSGDHNPYTKFNLGWITESRLVVAEDTITLTLKDFLTTGDTIILATDWREDLGAYQEYWVLSYYVNDGLNGGDFGYFDDEGILVHHVNASLYVTEEGGETYYDVYNTNTDANDEYGTEDNLIEYVTTHTGDYVYCVGDAFYPQTSDQGTSLGVTFTVDSIGGGECTITFN